MKGKHRSPETEFKVGHHPRGKPFEKGHTTWNKGMKGVYQFTPEQRTKMGAGHIGKRYNGGKHWTTHTCQVCGKQFETRIGEGKNRKYCSLECTRIGWSASREGRKSLIKQGYIKVRHNGGSHFEHRLVMEKILGRPLQKGEIVHHINFIKTDNHQENLLLMNQACHRALTDYLASLWVTEHPDKVDEVTRTFTMAMTSGG
jgi:hypothetical protein